MYARIKGHKRLALNLVAADDFGAGTFQKIYEGLAFVGGILSTEVRLHYQGEVAVATGPEPNGTDGLAKIAQVFFFDLFENLRDDFGCVHPLCGSIQQQAFVTIYEFVVNFPVGIFGFGLCGEPGLDFSRDSHVVGPGTELLLDVFETCRLADNRLWCGLRSFLLWTFSHVTLFCKSIHFLPIQMAEGPGL